MTTDDIAHPAHQDDEATRLRRLLDAATDHAILSLDLEGRITACNAGARAILSYAEEELLGRSGEELFAGKERAKGAFEAELCQALEEGRAINECWHRRRDGSRFWASGTTTVQRDEAGRPQGFVTLFRDATAEHAAEEGRALLLAETEHRVKNILATVGAVAGQTLRRAGVPSPVRQALASRLDALARAHERLVRGGWEGAPLADCVGDALAAWLGSGQVSAQGPPVWLRAHMVTVLTLALHELATNAAKHGALSMPGGAVSLRWRLRATSPSERGVEITWTERGGPPAAPPAREGFGLHLLRHGLSEHFGGAVTLDFRPEGLECRMVLPITGPE